MLWDEVEQVRRELNESKATLKQNGIKWAEAERDYRKQKSIEVLRLHAEKIPTTLIPDVVKGLDNVADLDFARNVRLVIYKANIEEINIKKIELKTTEAELEREFTND